MVRNIVFLILLSTLLYQPHLNSQESPPNAEEQTESSEGEDNKKKDEENTDNSEENSASKDEGNDSIDPSESSDFDVTWYQPEYEVIEVTSKRNKKKKFKRYKVTFLGKTDPKAKVKLGSKIYRVRGRKIKKLSTRKLIKSRNLRVKVEEDGIFRIPMTVSPGLIQIPVSIKKGDKLKKMQLVAKVNAGKIEVKDAEYLYKACESCIWLGLGFGVLNYQQDPPQDLKPVDYGSLTLPNISLRGSVKVAKKWNIRYDMHYLKGQDLSSNDTAVTILDKSISWTYFGLEAEYKAFSPHRLFGITAQSSLIAGVQVQSMPFVIEQATPIFTIGQFNFNSLSFGGVILLNPARKWQYEIFMRAQVALSGSGEIKLKSGFAFDGSVGAIYNINRNWKFGMFWNGQYHGYDYTVSGSDGTYSLLASNFDFSLGYQF